MKFCTVLFIVLQNFFARANAGNMDFNIEKISVLSIDKTKLEDFLLESYDVDSNTKGLRVQWKPTTEINETSATIQIHVEKFDDGKYELIPVEVDDTLYQLLQNEEVAEVAKKYCKPEIVWPIKTNVLYKCEHNVPDLSSIGNLAVGKWRLTSWYKINGETVLQTESIAVVGEN